MSLISLCHGVSQMIHLYLDARGLVCLFQVPRHLESGSTYLPNFRGSSSSCATEAYPWLGLINHLKTYRLSTWFYHIEKGYGDSCHTPFKIAYTFALLHILCFSNTSFAIFSIGGPMNLLSFTATPLPSRTASSANCTISFAHATSSSEGE